MRIKSVMGSECEANTESELADCFSGLTWQWWKVVMDCIYFESSANKIFWGTGYLIWEKERIQEWFWVFSLVSVRIWIQEVLLQNWQVLTAVFCSQSSADSHCCCLSTPAQHRDRPHLFRIIQAHLLSKTCLFHLVITGQIQFLPLCPVPVDLAFT